MNQKKLLKEIIIGIVCGLIVIILPVASAANTMLYDYKFPSDTQSWVSAGTCSGGSCVVTSGWNNTDGIPPGSLYFNQTSSVNPDRSTESTWSSPDLVWSNGIPTSVKLNFSYRVMVAGDSSVTIRAYIIKTDNTAVLAYQGIAITADTGWTNISVPVGTDNFTTAGNYKIRLNGTLFTSPGTAAVRWDTVNLTLIWETQQTYIPPAPALLTSSQDNFWINYTWQAGSPGNNTDSYNVSVNSFWTNGTTQTFNETTVGPHGTSTIIVYAYNSSAGGSLSLTSATDSKTLPNNPVTITNTSDRIVNEGDIVYVDYDRTDADGDTATFSTNRTDLFTDFNSATGQGNWVTDLSDAGTYYVDFGVSDGYGSISNYTMTITVNDVPQSFIPPAPTGLTSEQGNFWINYSWLPGLGFTTDSFNVSVNDFWTNGTTERFNLSNVGPHGWSNITVFAYNNSGGGSLSSNPATSNTQVANNVPIQTLADTWAITAGNMLTFTVSATDADSDILTFDTNATGGSLNHSTGVYKWMPASLDNGTYFWSFNSSDGYGGVATNTTTITVTDISGTYINGTVRSGGVGIKGVTVSTNTTISTETDEFGFYSLPVTAGAYELTASLQPVYYTSSPVTVVVDTGVVVRDIELPIKPTGTISGSVSNA